MILVHDPSPKPVVSHPDSRYLLEGHVVSFGEEQGNKESHHQYKNGRQKDQIGTHCRYHLAEEESNDKIASHVHRHHGDYARRT